MNINNTKQCIAFQRHDHSQCQNQLVRNAKALCEKRSVRLTPRRLQVLMIITGSHQPVGAYEILDRLNQAEQSKLRQAGKSQAIAPTIVYRALEFLIAEGLAHKIESKNAFISCDHPGHRYAAQFLICSSCEKIAELGNPDPGLMTKANNLGFKVNHSVVEITGICKHCRNNGESGNDC